MKRYRARATHVNWNTMTDYPGSVVHQLHNVLCFLLKSSGGDGGTPSLKSPRLSANHTTWKVRSELIVTVIRHFHPVWIFYSFSILAVLILIYWLLSYVVLPTLWRHYEHHPKLQDAPKTTETAENIPGDPLNVALVGTKAEVIQALLAIGWYPADPITFQTSIAIAQSVLLNRPYPCAPVSNLYLWGRKQDLAFELPIEKSTRQRHHIRFWQSNELGIDGRSLWMGAATFDRSVGLNHFTGQITHHIAPDVDIERDQMLLNLKQVGQLVQVYQVTGVGATLQGRNGGGDWYYTDGELTVGVLSVKGVVQVMPPSELPNSDPVKFKNQLWSLVRRFFKHLDK